MEPVECDRCGDEYDEEGGDGYCGLCPGCADEQYEIEDTAFADPS